MVYDDSGHAEGGLSIAKGKILMLKVIRTIAGVRYGGVMKLLLVAMGLQKESVIPESGECSHAEGCLQQQSGSASHAEGNECTTSGLNSTGPGTTANGTDSHTSGTHTAAENNSEFACIRDSTEV